MSSRDGTRWGVFASSFPLMEVAPLGCLLVDDQGRVVWANPEALRMFGYSREEMQGLAIEALIPERFRRAHLLYRQSYERRPATRRMGEGRDLWALHKDGTEFPVEISLSPIEHQGRTFVSVLFTDITKRKAEEELLRAKAELEESNLRINESLKKEIEQHKRTLAALRDLTRRYEAILDAVPDIMVEVDGRGRYIWVNQAGLEFFGPDVLGKHISCFAAEPDAAERFRPLFEGSEEVFYIESLQRRRDGVARLLAWWCRALKDAQGRVTGALATARDITEQVEAQEKLRRYRDELEELVEQRTRELTEVNERLRFEMEQRALEARRREEELEIRVALEERQRLSRELHDSVSQALYGIGLGARTALTLLEREPPAAAEPLKYILSLAEAALADMRSLILRLQPEQLEKEGLVPALARRCQALCQRYELQMDCQLGPEPDLPADRKHALYRVATEALHNVVKHAQATRLSLSLQVQEGRLRLCVADDGRGFDPEQEFPGHLGLRSMKERVERLGGSLAIDSHPGRGTRITAELPLG
ncbi:MAG TPA: PAS domain S-box protein [Candidatus Nitrosotenuis sp.]|nr:PAS domain S-box protein [Candidatus Nitrosotenuis sp.]